MSRKISNFAFTIEKKNFGSTFLLHFRRNLTESLKQITNLQINYRGIIINNNHNK